MSTEQAQNSCKCLRFWRGWTLNGVAHYRPGCQWHDTQDAERDVPTNSRCPDCGYLLTARNETLPPVLGLAVTLTAADPGPGTIDHRTAVFGADEPIRAALEWAQREGEGWMATIFAPIARRAEGGDGGSQSR